MKVNNDYRGTNSGPSAGSSFTGTGSMPPQFGGTAPMDNIAARMKNWVLLYPRAVKVVDRRDARTLQRIEDQSGDGPEDKGC